VFTVTGTLRAGDLVLVSNSSARTARGLRRRKMARIVFMVESILLNVNEKVKGAEMRPSFAWRWEAP
jgi:hypothetical protein